MENNVFQNAKTRRENPYKTLLKMIIFGPFSEKGSKIIKKALPREGFRDSITKEIQRKYIGNAKEIQRKYEGNTKGTQRKYKGNTKESQRKYKGNTKEIQRKYKGNTEEIQRKYKGNTKEIQRKALRLEALSFKASGS